MRIAAQESQSHETALIYCQLAELLDRNSSHRRLRKILIFGYSAPQKWPKCVNQQLARFLQSRGRPE
jgi:hypothetical protein